MMIDKQQDLVEEAGHLHAQGCHFVPEQIAKINEKPQQEQDLDHEPLPDDHEIEALTRAHDIPDGGMTAWLVVLGAWCVSFCSYGWINSEFTCGPYSRPQPSLVQCCY